MRAEKSQLVNDIGKILKDADFIFLIKYKGLKVKEFSDFREELSKHDSKCHVLKNRLIRKAAEINDLNDLTNLNLRDDTAVITGHGDPSSVAKVIEDFGKTNEAVSAKGGYMEGSLLADTDIKEIASLPSREVLLSQVIGVIQAPARNLVSVLNLKASEIVNVLNAYSNKLENK